MLDDHGLAARVTAFAGVLAFWTLIEQRPRVRATHEALNLRNAARLLHGMSELVGDEAPTCVVPRSVFASIEEHLATDRKGACVEHLTSLGS
jgi:hypothetical protein